MLGIGLAETILTSPLPYDINHNVRIKNNEDTFDIHLTKLLSSGHSYKQFEYNKLANVIKEEIEDASDDLDTVWELL